MIISSKTVVSCHYSVFYKVTASTLSSFSRRGMGFHVIRYRILSYDGFYYSLFLVLIHCLVVFYAGYYAFHPSNELFFTRVYVRFLGNCCQTVLVL